VLLYGQQTPGSSALGIAIKAPLSDSTVNGTITISAIAFANAGLASVQFLVDSLPIGAPVTVSPYTINWNSQSVANGKHNLSAVVFDTVGNHVTAEISVTISNAPPPPVSITLSPSNVSLTASQTQQFTATVTGSSNTGVSWSLNGPGSVSNAGLYTAPAAIAAAQNVTLTATSLADATKTAMATIGLTVAPPSVSITLSPSNVSLTASQTQQFTATVTGSSNTGVSWSLNGPGSVSNAGLYTAPAAIAAAQNVTLTATSLADATKTAMATIGLTVAPPSVSITLSPSNVSLTASQTQQFTATVTGSSNTGVSWSLNGPGSVSNAGLYTAPAAIAAAQNVTLTATSLADATKTAMATIGLTVAPPSVSITLSPSNVSLTASQTQQFTATVTGSSNTGVSWSLNGLGSVSNAGLYTAPTTISNAQSVTLTATSLADATKIATAIIALTLAPGTTPLGISISAPIDGSTVSGSVVISATPSGGPGVAGVQFLADNANIGAEVTAPPFTMNWDSLSVSNAIHTLSAMALDTTGKKARADISVRVNNIAPGAPAATFNITEAYGVTHPQQIVDFDFSSPVDGTNTYMVGPAGTEVPYQVLSSGKVAVQTDMPAGANRTWKLMTGRAPAAFSNGVTLTQQTTYYEIKNGMTGVRVVRPEGANDLTLAPIQGLQLQDGRWTATGPNQVLQPTYYIYPVIGPALMAKTMSATIVEKGPLKVSIAVTYTYDRPNLGNPPNILIPAGPGHYTSTITLEAGQPSIMILDDSDTDLQYYLNFYPEVQQDQGRWRGLGSSSLEFGHDVNTGGPYQGGLSTTPSDALRILPTALPFYPYPTTADEQPSYNGIHWTVPWNPWVYDTGWYWTLYNSSAGSQAPLVGMYATKSSTAIGAAASGPTPYGEPSGANGQRTGGFGFQINRYQTNAIVWPRVRIFWAIFVGTKGNDLGDPYTVQNIHRQMNLHGGVNLNKAYRWSAPFPDPPGGYTSLYMNNQAMNQIIQRVQTDTNYYNALKVAQPEIIPLLDMWRDTTGAQAQQLAAQIISVAQTFLDTLCNKSGVYDFNYHYWHGGLEMSRRAAFINELLRGNQVSAATKQSLKAVLGLFANLVWDEDYVPLADGSGLSLGTANMPVLQKGIRYMYTLQAPQIPSIAPYAASMPSLVSQSIEYQVDSNGAQMSAPNYMGAGMATALGNAQQMQTTGIADPFRSEPKLALFGQFFMDMLTPPEPRFGGVRKMPSIGDSPEESSEMYGELATGFAATNPALSSRLMEAWIENGKPQQFFYDSSVLRINDQLPSSPMNLRSESYPGWAAILRHNFGTPNETMTWLVDGDFYSDHRHADRGEVNMYALGAPLSIDWGSQYNPNVFGAYAHSTVVPEQALGTAWTVDSPSLYAASEPWVSGSQNEFESFDLSTRATATFQSLDGSMTWTRTARTLAPNPNYPILTVSDSFGGPAATTSKVFTLNLMAQGPVQSTVGTINPPLRLFSAYGSPQELPSTSPPLALSTGVNHFNFVGYWNIDWDLYQTSPSGEAQQVLIGNWAHNWVGTIEAGQFQAANGRPFEERQHIFRLHGNGGFNVLIMPYKKGTARSGVSVSTSGGVTTINAPGEQTLVSDAYYAYQGSQSTSLTTFNTAQASAFGIQVSGGPAEVQVAGATATISAHGPAGIRTIQIPGSWQVQAPLMINNGVITLNYQGGAPVRIQLTQGQ
jgi:hypothetical protein